MSTQFGFIKEDRVICIATRVGNKVFWTIEDFDIVAYYLDDEIPVVALTNTPQGIYTIGDLKKAISKKQ